MAESLVAHCILMSLFSECAPEMPEEKREFLKSSAANRSYETGPVKVKFVCAAASLFEHSRLAPSGKLSIHCRSLTHSRLATGGRIEHFVGKARDSAMTPYWLSSSLGCIKILVRVRFGGFQWSSLMTCLSVSPSLARAGFHLAA